MKRLSLYIALQSLGILTMMAQRGRLSQEEYDEINHRASSDEGSFIIGLAILIGIIALAFGLIMLWQWMKKHTEAVQDAIGTMVFAIIIAVGGFAVYKVAPPVFDFISSKINSNDTISNGSTQAPQNTAQSQQVLVVTNSPNNAWAGYPAPSMSANVNHKPNDFLVAVTNNPSFSIYDLITIVGLNEGNTQLLSYNEYSTSKYVRERYTPETLRQTHNKLQYAWALLKKYQYSNLDSEEIRKYMFNYSMWDTSKPNINDASNPQMIRELKTIPLY